MEIVLLVITYIEQMLKCIVDTLLCNIVDYIIMTLSVSILFDDIDTLKAIESIKKKNIGNKIEERNETFEAITTTKGHTDLNIQKRYILIMFIVFLIFLIEKCNISDNFISKFLSACALVITMAVKRKSNQNYDRLKRVKKL